MKAIVAVDNKWGIGKNNSLLFSLPADMAFFRQTTTGKVIVMGANTLKSFPGGKPLKNRVNVVLSTTLGKIEGAVTVRNLEELKKELSKYSPDDVYIIGGAKVYKTMLPFCSEALVTKVDADGDADAFFENLDGKKGWACISEGQPTQTNGFAVRFTVYKNSDIEDF